MNTIVSFDGKLFYIQQIAMTKGYMLYAGWLAYNGDNYYPFSMYEIRSDGNAARPATEEEISRYQAAFDKACGK